MLQLLRQSTYVSAALHLSPVHAHDWLVSCYTSSRVTEQQKSILAILIQLCNAAMKSIILFVTLSLLFSMAVSGGRFRDRVKKFKTRIKDARSPEITPEGVNNPSPEILYPEDYKKVRKPIGQMTAEEANREHARLMHKGTQNLAKIRTIKARTPSFTFNF